jgi:hypothetical protein
VRALTVLLGLPRMSFARLGFALALFVLALVLAIAGFIQLVGALRLALLMWTAEPALASLITGLILLLLGGLLVLVARLYLRRRVTMPQAAALGAGAEMAAQLMTLIRRNPGSAALIVALVGFVVGALPDLRRALGDALGPTRPKRRPPPPAEP